MNQEEKPAEMAPQTGRDGASTELREPPIGLLVVDKPLGCSSMDVVRVVRRRAAKAKTGHAGTLDPLATGVLVLCLGRAATKRINEIMATEKRYTTTIDLSAFSTTDDAEGEREPVEVISPPTIEQISEVLTEQFTGEIMQTPPAFSAMKVNGRRAYKMARKGEKVELKPRPIMIHGIEVIAYNWPQLEIKVHCGKGTYIRSLARDIGVALGTGGYLTALRRTAVGPYTIDQAIPLDDVPDPLLQEHLREVGD